MNKNIKALAAKKAKRDSDEVIPNARIRGNRDVVRGAQEAADAGYSVALNTDKLGFMSATTTGSPRPRLKRNYKMKGEQRGGNFPSRRQS